MTDRPLSLRRERRGRALVSPLVAFLLAVAWASPALAWKMGAGETIATFNAGVLATGCTASTVVLGGTPLSCSTTLPSGLTVPSPLLTLQSVASASVPTTAGRLVRDSTLNRLRYGDGTNGQIVGTSAVNAAAYLACNGTTDDSAAFGTILGSGGACAGKDCVIPAGCLVLLRSPGAGSATATLPSGTRLICEDRTTSTILAARHYCSGGNQPGAWADAATDCRSGTKSCDGTTDADDCEYAPTSGQTYTIVKSASLADKPAVIGCKFDLRQVEPYGRCAGGSQSGKACSTADTNATTGCPTSTCTVDPQEPAGDGKIIAIDFALAVDGTVEDVKVNNAKYSDYVVRIGPGNVARRLQVDEYDTNTPAIVPTFGLASLLTMGAGAVFDSSFGRGTIGVDAGANAAIVAHNRFTNTTSGIAGTGKLLADSNRIDALSGGGGYGIAAGDSSTIIGNSVTGAADGVRVGSSSEVSGNNLVTTLYGVRVNSAVSSGGSTNQITGNHISGQSRVGVELTSHNQVVGNRLTGGGVSDTSTSPVTPSTAITVNGVQNIVSSNYVTGSWFFGLHPVGPASTSFNIGIWSNRFAFGPIGPAIVTGGAGWHINGNYFNQTANGWCSDPTASSYLGACTCTTQQCKTGTELGKNCTVDGDCAGGTCSLAPVIDTTTTNPYGAYGSSTGTCFATGLNSGGTCDSTTTKADCTYAPIIQVGQDAMLPGATAYSSTSHPSWVVGRGWAATGGHNKIEGNILARGTGATDIDFADPLVCSGTNLASCQGTGGNAGQSCTADSDCTSTGCIWGSGNCCGYIFKGCATAIDCLAKQCDATSPTAPWGTSCVNHSDCGSGSHCQSVTLQCNATSLTVGAPGKVCAADSDCGDTTGTQCASVAAACTALSHSDTSIVGNYFYPGYQALDASQTNGSIAGLALNDNIVDASVRGFKFPSTASKLSRATVQSNQFHLAATKTGSELENWTTASGIATGNLGLSGGEQQTTEVYLKNREGAAMTAGYAVELITAVNDNAVQLAATGVGQDAIGVLAADCTNSTDAPCRVVLSGITDCYVSATVARGDRIKVDGSVRGNGVTAVDSDPAFARTLAARTGAGTVRCLVQPSPPSASLAASGVVMTGVQGLATGGTRYLIMGTTDQAGTVTTEANAAVRWPEGTINKMSCTLTAAPGAAKSRTFTLMVSNSASTMTCAISGAGTTNCSDTTHSQAIASGGAYLSLRAEVSSTPAGADVACAFSYTVTGF